MTRVIAILLAATIVSSAHAEGYIPKPMRKPPVPEINLHCFILAGDKRHIDDWITYGGDFERILSPCWRSMPMAACEAAKDAVNDFRPVVKNEWKVPFKLFAAMCSRASPIVPL